MSRLASGLLVNALVRRVQDGGGIATVLAKGDADSGMILIVATARGGNPRGFEPGWNEAGRRALVATGPIGDSEALDQYVARRRDRDRDLWVVELDSAEAERFAAETILGD